MCMGTVCKGLTPQTAGSLCHWTQTPKFPESTITSDWCLSADTNGFEALTRFSLLSAQAQLFLLG